MGQGLVEPNPCVGAVLFDEEESRLVSWGYHKRFGDLHAEAECFQNVDSAQGLTMVVTLEPCSHYGKTPPCADLLIEKKIKKLIYLSQDPNPQVSGRGLEKLKNHGIEVEVAPQQYEERNREQNARFFHAFENKEAFVHLKWAQTLDGKMARAGKSKWITSEESRMNSHMLRARSQMVIVGKNTVLEDDPSLNVRIKGYEKSLKVGVLDPELELENKLEDSNLLKVRSKEDVYLITNKKSENYQTIPLKTLKEGEGFFDLKDLKKTLFQEHKIQSVFVEGGAHTLNSFMNQSCFDMISVYIAPKFFGGAKTISPTEGLITESFKLLQSQYVVTQRGFLGNDSVYHFLKK